MLLINVQIFLTKGHLKYLLEVSQPEANATKVLQACIYKSVKTCQLLNMRSNK